MSNAALGPQLLPLNQLEHFYRGGARIAALRGGSAGGAADGWAGDGAVGQYSPEEWIGSVTTMAGQTALGLSRLADGTLLRDAVAADPEGWLGPRHVEAYGTSTQVLVKLLDAGQRLPVHAHPDQAFARHHLGLPHGKTEAWIVLEADEGARARIGFEKTMRLADLRAMTAAQDTEALVGALRSRPLRPGDGVLVPAGLPHCFDAGLLVAELQEPADLSILLEWDGFAIDGRQLGHLGLGFDTALQALRLDALDDAELDSLVLNGQRVPASGLARLLPEAADGYFRAHRLRSGPAGSGVEAGFAVVLVVAGAGHLLSAAGDRLDVRRGDAVVVPWRAGDWHLEGTDGGQGEQDGGWLEAMVCRPPLPTPR